MKRRFLLSALCLALTCSSCSLYGTELPLEDYTTELSYHDGFRILQMSDLHFSSWDDLDEDLSYMDYLFREANAMQNKPVDLLVVTGDLFTFVSQGTVRYTLDHINSWNVPWTLIFGNHDEQVYGSYTYASQYASTLSNCLFSFHDNDSLTGLSNSIIELKDDASQVVYQLFCIDSNTYSYKEGISYDWVHQDQIDWYKKAVETVNKKQNPDYSVGDENVIPSLVFQHIPLPEYVQATEAYQQGKISGNGESREKSCPPAYNSGFFDVIKEYHSTKAVITGHDHLNNSDVIYEGVHFIYGVKSTDNIYHDDDLLGYRLITLDRPDSFSTTLHYHTYKEALNHD